MTTIPIDEVLQNSVTAGEFSSVRNGSVLNLMIPLVRSPYEQLPLPPVPPVYWTWGRDIVMRATVHQEAMWGAAVGIAINKAASKGFEAQGGVPLRVRQAQKILLNADGRKVGWVGFLSKHLRDFLTTDNGSHIEIVRATKAYGSRIVGLRHLDSLRVTRTGDPRIPALYRDRYGRIHEMKDHQIISLSDMPDPSETYYGVGLSAASRSYSAIYKLGAIEGYLREKVAGLRPLAIYIVNGVLDKQLKDAVTIAQQEQVARGLVSYMGAVIVGIPDEVPPQVATIPLAELPDRFARKEEFDIAVLTYADNLGLDPQDLQPLSSGTLGQNAQSQVLADKARGKGVASWAQQFTHLMNEWVMPDEVRFVFTEKDYRDIEQRTNISKLRADVAATRITAQMTTPQQELKMLVDMDELPKEFLPGDMATEERLGDGDKPTTTQGQNAVEVPNEIVKPPEPVAPVAPGEKPAAKPAEKPAKPTTKEFLKAQNILDGVLGSRIKELMKEATKPEAPEIIEEAQEKTTVTDDGEGDGMIVIKMPRNNITVQVPQQAAPIVQNTTNVNVPEQKAPIIQVKPVIENKFVAPETPITFQAGDVNVNVPEQKAPTAIFEPIIKVTTPEPNVQIENVIHVESKPITSFKIDRGSDGKMTEIVPETKTKGQEENDE